MFKRPFLDQVECAGYWTGISDASVMQMEEIQGEAEGLEIDEPHEMLGIYDGICMM